MSRLHAAQFTEALDAIDFVLGCAGEWMPIEFRQEHRASLFWHHTGVPGSGARLAWLVRACDERWSDEILLRLPQRRRWHGGVTRSAALWARVEGTEQLRKARAFRPLPTLVLQEGASSRRLLLWALEQTLDWPTTRQFNRRIAYRLGAVQKWADPDALRVPAPGTCIRFRDVPDPTQPKEEKPRRYVRQAIRPVPVRVARLTTASFRAQQVAGRLKDPPEIKFENGQVVVERSGGFR